jgi:predicted ATPase
MQAKTATKAKTAIQASQPRCYAKRLNTRPKGRFVEHLGSTKVTQQSVTKFIAMIFINVLIPKAAAKNRLLLNKLAPGTEIDQTISYITTEFNYNQKRFILHAGNPF